jgi:hypothetical protein
MAGYTSEADLGVNRGASRRRNAPAPFLHALAQVCCGILTSRSSATGTLSEPRCPLPPGADMIYWPRFANGRIRFRVSVGAIARPSDSRARARDAFPVVWIEITEAGRRAIAQTNSVDELTLVARFGRHPSIWVKCRWVENTLATARFRPVGARYQTQRRGRALRADNGLAKLGYERLRDPRAPANLPIRQLAQIRMLEKYEDSFMFLGI